MVWPFCILTIDYKNKRSGSQKNPTNCIKGFHQKFIKNIIHGGDVIVLCRASHRPCCPSRALSPSVDTNSKGTRSFWRHSASTGAHLSTCQYQCFIMPSPHATVMEICFSTNTKAKLDQSCNCGLNIQQMLRRSRGLLSLALSLPPPSLPLPIWFEISCAVPLLGAGNRSWGCWRWRGKRRPSQMTPQWRRRPSPSGCTADSRRQQTAGSLNRNYINKDNF